MIFPELPKRWNHEQIGSVIPEPKHCEHTEDTAKAPLRGIDVEEWFAAHGLPNMATDPAAASRHFKQEPIDWLAKDAWEFYALCVTMICWTVYWYGVHMGAW